MLSSHTLSERGNMTICHLTFLSTSCSFTCSDFNKAMIVYGMLHYSAFCSENLLPIHLYLMHVLQLHKVIDFVSNTGLTRWSKCQTVYIFWLLLVPWMWYHPVAQLREAMEAVASGRPWKGGAACRQQCFFILFNYKILSRFVDANDTALNTLRPIRPCFTASNNQLGL